MSNKKYEGDERRRQVFVYDKPTEKGITLNNIISFLVLCVITWVGTNIEKIKDDISSLNTATAINALSIKNNVEKIDHNSFRIDKVEKKINQIK